MTSPTTRFALNKIVLGFDNVDVVADFNNNWDAIDLRLGSQVCTSATLPSSPPTGLTILVTDLGKFGINTGTPASPAWLYFSSAAVDWISVKGYGATGNTRSFTDAAITASTNLLNSAAGAVFTSADVGRSVFVPGAGAAGGLLSTTVASFNSSTQVVLSANASTTVSGATALLGTDDTTAIQNALNAANTQGGGIVLFPWGNYLVSSSPSVPPYVSAIGETALSLPQTVSGVISNFSRIIASPAWAPSSTTGIMEVRSKTPGGWSINNAGAAIKNLVVDGTFNTNTNLQGINLVGPIYDTHIEDVLIQKAPHNGISSQTQTETGISVTSPYHQRFNRVTINAAVNGGFSIANFTDTTLTNCLAFGNGSDGYTLNNNSNTVLSACRAEWNSGRGFNISGSGGSLVLDGCTTDQNTSEGIRINTATGQTVQGGGIIITGGKFHADGNGGTNNNGIRIVGSTVPVTITGVNIESGQDVNNSNFYPANAILIGTSSNVIVSSSILQGITSAWNDGGGNTNVVRKGCIGMTGNPNTQTTAILGDLPQPNAFGATSSVTVTASTVSTTETALTNSYPIPANDAVAGATYKIVAWGYMTTSGTPPTLTFRVRLGGTGGTAIAATAALTPTASLTNTGFWKIEAILTCFTTGASGTWSGVLSLLDAFSSTLLTADDVVTAVPTAVRDTTVSNSLIFTVTYSANTTGNSILCAGSYGERLV